MKYCSKYKYGCKSCNSFKYNKMPKEFYNSQELFVIELFLGPQ